MKNEKVFLATSGYLMLLVVFIILAATITGLVIYQSPWFIIGFVLAVFLCIGFVIVSPNESSVLVLFGEYKGSIKQNGFFWTNPFFLKRKISLRARNFDSNPIKVNDKVGNPIKIGVVLVWKVEETFKAAFDVDEYEHFVV
ncbi:MAG: SPFH domain-containing protein, partial [Bacteroidales bacterium]|nr:SPFH domain-containing protein [Bacteroidales bacterium]